MVFYFVVIIIYALLKNNNHKKNKDKFKVSEVFENDSGTHLILKQTSMLTLNTVCTIYYTEKTNLDIDKVMLLDRVQKKYTITKEQSDYLKKGNLIEGRFPKIYISSSIAKITDEKEEYMDNKGLENAYYKDYIVSFIEKFGSATRQDINNFIYPKLPSNLSEEEKTTG